jgi:hypothetical protein
MHDLCILISEGKYVIKDFVLFFIQSFSIFQGNIHFHYIYITLYAKLKDHLILKSRHIDLSIYCIHAER